jgi:hypothetical protein
MLFISIVMFNPLHLPLALITPDADGAEKVILVSLEVQADL